jgi:hypothetical protein
MTTFRIVLICLFSCLLIRWLRQGSSFPIVQTLPLLGGHQPGLYDAGSFLLLLLAIWGFGRLARFGRDDND